LSGSVLITHPFHPLSGQWLEVLFAKRRAGAVVLVGESARLGRVTVRGQPSSRARETRSYWRAVDSRLGSTCIGVDWRT
jgi:hypothetical protein